MSDEGSFEDRVREVTYDNASGRKLSGEQLAELQPGLARLMPEVGNRVWKLYYAGKAENWPLAKFQLKEANKLLQLCGLTRPKYETAIASYIEQQMKPIGAAIEAGSVEQFEKAFDTAVVEANNYHDAYGKPFLVWKVPSFPPPDLDFTPRPKKTT